MQILIDEALAQFVYPPMLASLWLDFTVLFSQTLGTSPSYRSEDKKSSRLKGLEEKELGKKKGFLYKWVSMYIFNKSEEGGLLGIFSVSSKKLPCCTYTWSSNHYCAHVGCDSFLVCKVLNYLTTLGVNWSCQDYALKFIISHAGCHYWADLFG